MVVVIDPAGRSTARHKKLQGLYPAVLKTRKLARKMVHFLCIMGGLYVLARIACMVK